MSGGVNGAAKHEEQVVHGVAFGDNGLSGFGLVEVETRVGYDVLHVAVLNALKEWQLVKVHILKVERLNG